MRLLFSSLFYNILLFILVVIAGAILWYNSTPAKPKKLALENDYDAFATHVISTQFSSTGNKRYELITPRLNHYKQENKTYAVTPKLYLYNSENDKWQITAEYALATHGEALIDFIEHVDISGADTNNHKNTQLLTEKISYSPEKNMATTDAPVTIVQPGSIIHATGMNVDFNTGNVTLKSKISGSYNPGQK